MESVALREDSPRFRSLISNIKNRKDTLPHSLARNKLDFYASKEVDQQVLVFSPNSDEFLIFKEGKHSIIRGNSKPFFSPLCVNKKEEQGWLSLDIESMEVMKVSSAKRMLKHLGQSYGNTYNNQLFDFGEGCAKKESFLNSSLLHLISATDGNEDTAGHSQLVARYTILLAKAFGIEDKDFLCNVQRGALLHDIGKIGIPEFILRKAGPLNKIEKEIVKDHPVLGYELIEEFDFLKMAAHIILFHHESYDGNGYPFGLSGDEIPLEARIFALADTLDAITSDRTYREGKSFEEAFREIERSQGSQFDPQLVDVFLSIPKEEWQSIKEESMITLAPSKIH